MYAKNPTYLNAPQPATQGVKRMGPLGTSQPMAGIQMSGIQMNPSYGRLDVNGQIIPAPTQYAGYGAENANENENSEPSAIMPYVKWGLGGVVAGSIIYAAYYFYQNR